MILEFVEFITEDITGRTPHPEDAIFNGSAAAAQALKGLNGAIAAASQITIKWDGSPALIFGRTPEGRLAVMDKYMFDAGFLAQSPEDWQRYDQQKSTGKLRPDLYQRLATIWAGLDAAVAGPGFYWGDLMYAGRPPVQAGKFVFQPVTVQYRVPTTSELGRIIGQSVGGIVVHQQFSELGGAPSKWNGKGLQNVKGGVAIIKPDMGIKFKLKEPVGLSKAANAAVTKYGAAVDDLMATIPQSTRDRIKTYFNKRITGQTQEDLHTWLKANTSAKQYQALAGDDFSGSLFATDASGQITESLGYAGLKAIWNSIYAYKVNLSQQLDAQVKGLEQYVGNTPGGEGFVFPTPAGLVKIVNRGQFGVAHFNK